MIYSIIFNLESKICEFFVVILVFVIMNRLFSVLSWNMFKRLSLYITTKLSGSTAEVIGGNVYVFGRNGLYTVIFCVTCRLKKQNWFVVWFLNVELLNPVNLSIRASQLSLVWLFRVSHLWSWPAFPKIAPWVVTFSSVALKTLHPVYGTILEKVTTKGSILSYIITASGRTITTKISPGLQLAHSILFGCQKNKSEGRITES